MCFVDLEKASSVKELHRHVGDLLHGIEKIWPDPCIRLLCLVKHLGLGLPLTSLGWLSTRAWVTNWQCTQM